MNQLFSLSRFWKLVTAHWTENRKRYGIGLLAIGGLLVVWFSFVLAMTQPNGIPFIIQGLTYYFGLFFTGCLFASMAFSPLHSRPAGIQYLLMPASHLEKLLCALLFGIVLFFIVYTLIFYLVDIPMVRLSYSLGGGHIDQVTGGNGRDSSKILYEVFGEDWNASPGSLLIPSFFAIQSAFILGSVYFTRYNFIKTIVALSLFILVMMLYLNRVIERNLPGGWMTDDLLGWHHFDHDSGQSSIIQLPAWAGQLMKIVLNFGGPIMLGLVTYVRLKEKEV